jgi:hypothetical protein
VTGDEHVVVLTPRRIPVDPDVYVLRCACGWEAEVHGMEGARAAAVAHEDRRSDD